MSRSLVKTNWIIFQIFLESTDQLESLEKELRITTELKDAMKASISDSALFLFYDTYFRTFTPDTVNKAHQDVREAIAKLNTLRPNWIAEENIEFPDERSRVMYELGLSDGPRWPWGRILLMSTGGLLILLAIVSKTKNHFSQRDLGLGIDM